MSIRDTLAQIISGESSSYQGRQAVTNVLQNRYDSSNFPSSWSAIATPNQFDALNHASQADAQSYAFADQLLAGNPPPDITGGATYFVGLSRGSSYGGVQGATGPATAGIISGGNNIGGNYFSDRWGAPSSSFKFGSGSTAPTGDAFQSTLQQSYPNDPTLGGLYPAGQSWADTTSDVQQDYLPSGQLDTSKFGNLYQSPDVSPMAFAGNQSQFSGLDLNSAAPHNSPDLSVTPTDSGTQTGSYQGQDYTFATPGGPQSAAGYGLGGPQVDNSTAPTAASGLNTDTASYINQGGQGPFPEGALSGLDANQPGTSGQINPMDSGTSLGSGSGTLDASAPTGSTDTGLPGPLGQVDGSGAPSSGGQATDFLGGAFQGAYGSGAIAGLDKPLQEELGGTPLNITAPTSDFSGTAPQAQAKTPASTEGQIAQSKATEDLAKSDAKAADTIAKAFTNLAKQQQGTGQQSNVTNAQDTKVQTTSAADIANTQLGTLKDLTQRTFIVLFGIIMLAGAVYYFSSSARPSPAHA